MLMLRWSGVVLVVLLLVRSAAAQSGNNSRQEAQQALELADQAFGQKDYQRALALYERAYELFPDPRTRFNIGITQQELGNAIAAADAFDDYLEGATDVPPERRTRVEDIVAELDRGLGKISFSGVSDAMILVDAVARGTKPLTRPIRVKPGPHEVEVRKAGYATFHRSIEVTAGRIVEVTVQLEAAQSAARPLEPRDESRPSWARRHRWSIIAGTTAVALAVAGTGVGLWTWSSYADLSNTCGGGCREVDLDAVETKAFVTNMLLGGAVVAGVASVVLYVIFERAPASTERVSLQPTARGVHLLVRF